MSLISIDEANALHDHSQFSAAVGVLFEPVPILAQRLYDSRPYKSWHDVLEYASDIIYKCSEEERVELLKAHPKIGERQGKLSALSKAEQNVGVILEQEQAVLEELATLNDAYEQKFGFIFTVFVNGRTKADILPVFRERLQGTRDEEIQNNINSIMAIAVDRLHKLSSTPKR